MLEAALVILPLFALAFAMVDIPLGIFVQNVLRNAVREGARFAITQQTGTGGQDAAIKAVVQNNAMGFLSNATYISISYLNGQTLAAATGVGSNAQGNICTITVANYPWVSVAPIWRSGSLTFNAASSDVMEAPPNGVLPGR